MRLSVRIVMVEREEEGKKQEKTKMLFVAMIYTI